MSMTRKHFQLIADSLRYAKPCKVAKPQGFKHRHQNWRNTVEIFSDRLATQNPNFDRERFEAACGLEEQERERV